MKNFIFIIILYPFISFSQVITDAEYFIDTDPGFGNGTPITIPSPSQLINLSFTVSTVTLSEGIHKLNIRVKDNDGVWSLYESRLLYINSLSTPANVNYLEYFFNSDPGLGNGTPINISIPGQTINIATVITTAGLNNGFNVLFIRAKDSNDLWSLYESRLIYINDTIQKTIVSAEYFIDTVGTPGSGAPLTVTNPGNLVTFSDDFITSNLALGNYSIYIRVQDDQGVWSHYEKIDISICTTFGPLSDFNYYITGNTVFFTNNSQNSDATTWIFGDGNTDNLKINPSHSYSSIGEYNVQLVTQNICGIDTMDHTIVISGVKSINPNFSGNVNYISTIIKGFGFTPGAEVRLIKSNEPDIIADTAITIDSYTIKANFPIDSAAFGYWDVVVIIPGGLNDTLYGAFEIQPNEPQTFSVEIVGRSRIRFNTYEKYIIAVSNNGNTTAFGVPVVITTAPDKFVLNDFEIYEDSLTLIATSFMNHFELYSDSISGDSVLIGNFVIYELGPGETKNLTITYLSTSLGISPLYASVNPPLTNPYSLDLLKMSSCNFLPDCLGCMLDIAGGVPGPIGCVSSTFNLGCSIGNNINSGGNSLGDLAQSIAGTAVSCATPAGNVLHIVLGAAGTMGSVFPSLLTPNGSCHLCFCGKKCKKKNDINIATSLDPNLKQGPVGFQLPNYTSGDIPFYYTIYFENYDTATAPAAEVIIKDQIDTSKFDLSTFEFIEFGFGDTIFQIDEIENNYVRDIPLSNIILRVTAALDVGNGLLTWKFTSFEPDTMALTTDPAKGFLPPNVNSPEGEGFIRFRINLKPGYQHLDVIENDAEIIFDTNTPIITPVWSNTLDLEAPQSNVLTLSNTQADTAFVIKWSGNDLNAGIAYYDIWVSVNDSAYYKWINALKIDSAIFHGQNGNKYEFYSIGVDNLMNIEEPPLNADLNPDAVTTIITSVEEITGTGWMNLYPNPATSEVLCNYFIAEKANTDIELTDLLGRIILNIDLKKREPGQHQIKIDVSNISTGYYILNLKLNGKKYLREKLLINH